MVDWLTSKLAVRTSDQRDHWLIEGDQRDQRIIVTGDQRDRAPAAADNHRDQTPIVIGNRQYRWRAWPPS